MAKYTGIPPITGTIGPICIYKMYGQYYIRTRSSLTGKRVKKDPAFRKTMQYATLLAKASRIGSAVYALLPAGRKQHSLYRKITGEAMYWLKHEWSTDDVLIFLQKLYCGQEMQTGEPNAIEREQCPQQAQQLKSGTYQQLQPKQIQETLHLVSTKTNRKRLKEATEALNKGIHFKHKLIADTPLHPPSRKTAATIN